MPNGHQRRPFYTRRSWLKILAMPRQVICTAPRRLLTCLVPGIPDPSVMDLGGGGHWSLAVVILLGLELVLELESWR